MLRIIDSETSCRFVTERFVTCHGKTVFAIGFPAGVPLPKLCDSIFAALAPEQ